MHILLVEKYEAEARTAITFKENWYYCLKPRFIIENDFFLKRATRLKTIHKTEMNTVR
jgi:hypothetical protein